MKKIVCMFFISLFCCANLSQIQAQNDGKGQSTDSELSQKNKKYEVIKITQEEFKKKVFDYTDSNSVYKGKKAAIVDCYADWCGPCKRLAPVLQELAKEYGDKIVFYKINTDENKELSRTLGITSIPTIYFFPVKGEPRKAIGGLSKEQLIEIIEKIVLPKKE